MTERLFPLAAVDPHLPEDEARDVPVICEYRAHHWTARVLYDVEAGGEWPVTWTDGINLWFERYAFPWQALARLAALVAAVEQDVLLVHDPGARDGDDRAFVDEAERFVRRTVHAFNCPADCRGDSPLHGD